IKTKNRQKFYRRGLSTCKTWTRNGKGEFITLCALLRSALRAETKFQTRARLDEATSTIHLPRAHRLQVKLKPMACARRNKSCRKPSRAVRAIAPESATVRRGSNPSASRSPQDRHDRFEIGWQLLPTESPANAVL